MNSGGNNWKYLDWLGNCESCGDDLEVNTVLNDGRAYEDDEVRCAASKVNVGLVVVYDDDKAYVTQWDDKEYCPLGASS